MGGARPGLPLGEGAARGSRSTPPTPASPFPPRQFPYKWASTPGNVILALPHPGGKRYHVAAPPRGPAPSGVDVIGLDTSLVPASLQTSFPGSGGNVLLERRFLREAKNPGGPEETRRTRSRCPRNSRRHGGQLLAGVAADLARGPPAGPAPRRRSERDLGARARAAGGGPEAAGGPGPQREPRGGAVADAARAGAAAPGGRRVAALAAGPGARARVRGLEEEPADPAAAGAAPEGARGPPAAPGARRRALGAHDSLLPRAVHHEPAAYRRARLRPEGQVPFQQSAGGRDSGQLPPGSAGGAHGLGV